MYAEDETHSKRALLVFVVGKHSSAMRERLQGSHSVRYQQVHSVFYVENSARSFMLVSRRRIPCLVTKRCEMVTHSGPAMVSG